MTTLTDILKQVQADLNALPEARPVEGLQPWPGTLSPIIRPLYDVAEGCIAGRRVRFLIDKGDGLLLQSSLRQHAILACGDDDVVVIYVTTYLSDHARRRLREQQVHFIVLDHAVHLPSLGVFRRSLLSAAPWCQEVGLRPASQALLLHWIYHGCAAADTPTRAARALCFHRHSAMRAFSELRSVLAQVEGMVFAPLGEMPVVQRIAPAQVLWSAGKPALRSPIAHRFRATAPSAQRAMAEGQAVRAGYSALDAYTMLAAPREVTVATTQREAASLERLGDATDGATVEVWTYAPWLHQRQGATLPGAADPLSVWLSFRGDTSIDERTDKALDELLDQAPWH